MPELAGQPLEPPRFHKVNWVSGQRFSQEDDPDRTREPWAFPGFVIEQDPKTRHESMSVEELRVPYGSARVVRHVLSEEQCAELLARVNGKGFTPALLNIGHGAQQLTPEVRDGHRIIVDSPEMASWLLEVLRPFLPEQLPDGSRLVDLNERMRFLCYTPGQAFDEHYDGCYSRPEGPRKGDMSRVTVQLYLHDVPGPCGGATAFFPGRSNGARHQPEAGSVLIFTQDLPHEGTLVERGIKYTLRTEAMYTRGRPRPCRPSLAA